ncbi:MAG: hypothetical protein NW203_03435 [Hyphomonadaceae bacterium]|nr:hypothetical protein [Hyphomonadaceae bacterium]
MRHARKTAPRLAQFSSISGVIACMVASTATVACAQPVLRAENYMVGANQWTSPDGSYTVELSRVGWVTVDIDNESREVLARFEPSDAQSRDHLALCDVHGQREMAFGGDQERLNRAMSRFSFDALAAPGTELVTTHREMSSVVIAQTTFRAEGLWMRYIAFSLPTDGGAILHIINCALGGAPEQSSIREVEAIVDSILFASGNTQ